MSNYKHAYDIWPRWKCIFSDILRTIGWMQAEIIIGRNERLTQFGAEWYRTK